MSRDQCCAAVAGRGFGVDLLKISSITQSRSCFSDGLASAEPSRRGATKYWGGLVGSQTALQMSSGEDWRRQKAEDGYLC